MRYLQKLIGPSLVSLFLAHGLAAQQGETPRPATPGSGARDSTTSLDRPSPTGRRARRRHWQIKAQLVFRLGFVGDWRRPNFFARASNLGSFKYAQIMATRKLTPRNAVFAQYDRLNGADYVRVALRVAAPALRLIDSARPENVTRLSKGRANGVAVTLYKTLRRMALALGLSSVDAHIGFPNGDQIDYGRRLIARARYPLSAEVDLAFYYGRGLARALAVQR